MIVKGKIKDEYGFTPGATIKELGTNPINAVPSDNNGNFSINVASPQSELEITFIGLKTVRVKASDVSASTPIFLATDSIGIEPIEIKGTNRKSNLPLWLGAGALVLIGSMLITTSEDSIKEYEL